MPSFKFASATGSGSSLIVTCSEQFAGKTITCTNGTKTYTRTCPSTSPYEVVFKGIAPGTWTVSGVVEGRTYSQQVVITDFDVTLDAGFDYKRWVTLGGLDPTDYASLSEVFADEIAVRRLMTIHASADYLIKKVTDDIDTIDDFTANDTAMKWIGLRDYVCDGLTAITGVEAKFLASQYWERYLKDHVPVMTSNTAPYGTARANSTASGYDAYKAFDNDVSNRFSTSLDTNGWLEYKFTNPICVKRVKIKSYWDGTYSRIKEYKIQASNDGSTYEDLGTFVYPNENVERIIDLTNTTPYLYYRIYVLNKYVASAYFIAITSLQFYGRSLNEIVSTTPTDGRRYLTLNNTIYSVSWTEREFAEGSTMKYLYDHGVKPNGEFETYKQQSASTLEDSNDRLYVASPGTNINFLARFGKTENLNNYNLIRAVAGDEWKSNDSYGPSVGISNALNSSAWIARAMFANTIPNPNTSISVDISSVSESKYVCFGNGGEVAVIRLGSIKELWLE